jgi:hypothetical protein
MRLGVFWGVNDRFAHVLARFLGFLRVISGVWDANYYHVVVREIGFLGGVYFLH